METLKAIIQYKLPVNKSNKNNLYSVSGRGHRAKGRARMLKGSG